MRLLTRVSPIFHQKVNQLSFLAARETEITLKTCGKFYAANNKQFLYRRGTADGVSVRLKFLDTHPSCSSTMPTVLAIHGSPGSWRDFEDLVARLNARGCRVIAPNFPNMSLTDSNHTFYHSTGEKYELLTDFLAAIGAPSFDLALMHSSGVYPTMKLWNDKPGSIRSLMLINPPGHRRIKAMKPEWFVSSLARLNMIPVGRLFYKNLGYLITKAAKVSVNSSKEDADNLVLALMTMHLAGVARLTRYAQSLRDTATPTSYIFSDRDKLVDLKIFHELITSLGASKQNINTVRQGQLVEKAERELDWLRIFNLSGGGHYAFKQNICLLEQEAARLIDEVYSPSESRTSRQLLEDSLDSDIEELHRNAGRAYAININSYLE